MKRERYSILIVDDEKTNLDVLSAILGTEYKINVAKSGIAAIKKSVALVPDLILLDVVMPDLSGFDVLVEIRNNPVTHFIPVIMVTGLSTIEDQETGFAIGANDYITKPFSNTIVKARVKQQIENVKHIRMIEKLGMFDPLTDIPNRRHFDTLMEREWGRSVREKQSISILMIDADNFKKYNDTYGHPQGDVLLQHIARIIASNTARRATDFIARIGGEEFVVALPNTPLDGAVIVAEKIRKAVEELSIPTIRGDSITKATISIGVASLEPAVGDDTQALIAAADKKLYEAKQTGKNKVCS